MWIYIHEVANIHVRELSPAWRLYSCTCKLSKTRPYGICAYCQRRGSIVHVRIPKDEAIGLLQNSTRHKSVGLVRIKTLSSEIHSRESECRRRQNLRKFHVCSAICHLVSDRFCDTDGRTLTGFSHKHILAPTRFISAATYTHRIAGILCKLKVTIM